MSFGARMISSSENAAEIQRKLRVLRAHCDALGRPYETALRALYTGWLILAEDQARVQAKLQHYFPEGLERSATSKARSSFSVPL